MTVKEQLRTVTPILIIVFAATLVLLSGVIMVGMEHNIQLNHFTKDPAQITGTPFYLGFFSYIGILLWCGSAVVCFFARAVLPKSVETKAMRTFLFYSGLVTTLLMFDDLFLFHEEVFPRYFGIPEKGVFIIYINILVLYLILFRETILKTEFLVLGMAFILVGLSTFVKRIPMPIPEDSFLEDAVKLFGISCWFIYFLRLAYKEVMKTFY